MKLLDQVRQKIRIKHYSYRTEQTYVHWIKRFIIFHNKRHPKDLGEKEIGQFLSELAVKGQVSASTQNQALNALVFLYKYVIQKDLDESIDFFRAKKPKRLPVVLSQHEVSKLLEKVEGSLNSLMISLIYTQRA